jgi:hypothetical protein
MRLLIVAAMLAAGAACVLPDSVDAACPEEVIGATDGLSVDGLDFMMRVQCHRRFLGLNAGKVTGPAQTAAGAHAAYIESNGLLDPASENFAFSLDDLFLEREGFTAFTGVTANDRLVAAGAFQANAGTGTWDIFISSPSFTPDDLFADPYLRDAFLQPAWIGAGIADIRDPVGATAARYFNMAYAFPSNRLIVKPLVYPRDGQFDVPTEYTTRGSLDDPLSIAPTIGFPITVMVGSDRVEGTTNAYNLQIISARLEDADGTVVSLIEVEPARFSFGSLTSTAIFAPTTILRPGVDYTFEATVEWNIRRATVKTQFRTADDGIGVP